MCGLFFSNGIKPLDDLRSIEHRGPDFTSILESSGYTYGFCRLAIRKIDSGHQPSVSPGYVSAINGELYNENEVISLIREIDPLVSIPDGDMNVLSLYLFLTNGFGIKNTKGMFAGFVHFLDEKKVIFFRDAIGEKPLFMYLRNSVFALSSEHRFENLIADPDTVLKMNMKDLVSGHALWKSECSIECSPGTLYSFEFSTMKLKSFCYYSWPRRKRILSRGDIFGLEKAILESIAQQSASDHPISILLSSGIDSSLIAYFAKRKLEIDLHAFTLRMNDPNWNEVSVAKKFSKELDIEHSEISYSDEEIASLVPEILSAMDVPILDTACISVYLLTKGVSQSHRVAFSGDGGDEISRGYELYRWIPFLKIARLFRLEHFLGVSQFVCRNSPIQYNSIGMKINRAKDVIAEKRLSIPEVALSPFAGTELFYKMTENMFLDRSKISTEEYYSNRILPRVFLAKSDRMSMKNSVEIRSPYLDRDVINESMNFSSLETVFNHRKWILKNMAKKYLPNYLIARGKQGFSLSFSRVIPHLKEPSWDDELVKISGASLPQIWKLARNDQNHAMAAWSLMVINHFLVQKKLHISIGMSE